MDKYRIRLDNTRMYPRSVFWKIEEYSESYGGYREVRSGVVGFFGKKSAIRTARRALKKYQKFHLYDELYRIDGTPFDTTSFFEDDPYEGAAWCVKCKDKVTFTGKVKVAPSGRRMAVGKCPKCKTKVNRILGRVVE